MSLFEHRKPMAAQSSRDVLSTLRSTLEKLEAEAEETPQMSNLKRILADRISELERKSA
jgi:BMFP domain-containing protein YqiC